MQVSTVQYLLRALLHQPPYSPLCPLIPKFAHIPPGDIRVAEKRSKLKYRRHSPLNMQHEVYASIRVVPAMIDTAHVMDMIAPDQDVDTMRASRTEQVPMKRQDTGWDVAEAALFIASDAAPFITGVNSRMDGGIVVLVGNAAKNENRL